MNTLPDEVSVLILQQLVTVDTLQDFRNLCMSSKKYYNLCTENLDYIIREMIRKKNFSLLYNSNVCIVKKFLENIHENREMYATTAYKWGKLLNKRKVIEYLETLDLDLEEKDLPEDLQDLEPENMDILLNNSLNFNNPYLKQNVSVLHSVLLKKRYDIASKLLRNGYDINMIDFTESYTLGEPMTLLDSYEYTGDTKGISWLITHGAKTAEELGLTHEMLSRVYS
jgi:hypothetical protein